MQRSKDKEDQMQMIFIEYCYICIHLERYGHQHQVTLWVCIYLQLTHSYPTAVADLPLSWWVKGWQLTAHQRAQILHWVDPQQHMGPATRRSKKKIKKNYI